MKTKITPIEALENIAKTGCTRVNNMFQCNTCGEGNKSVCPRYIATQALAPQETQQKTFTMEEVKRIQTQTLITLSTEEDVRKCKWLFSVFNSLLAEFEQEAE